MFFFLLHIPPYDTFLFIIHLTTYLYHCEYSKMGFFFLWQNLRHDNDLTSEICDIYSATIFVAILFTYVVKTWQSRGFCQSCKFQEPKLLLLLTYLFSLLLILRRKNSLFWHASLLRQESLFSFYIFRYVNDEAQRFF